MPRNIGCPSIDPDGYFSGGTPTRTQSCPGDTNDWTELTKGIAGS
jgi:hypothetical protein